MTIEQIKRLFPPSLGSDHRLHPRIPAHNPASETTTGSASARVFCSKQVGMAIRRTSTNPWRPGFGRPGHLSDPNKPMLCAFCLRRGDRMERASAKKPSRLSPANLKLK